MKKLLTFLGITAVMFVSAAHAQILYWNTNGVSAGWTAANWGTAPEGPFTTAWVAGNAAVFSANSTNNFLSSTVGNVTVSNGITVKISNNQTLTLGGVRTFDVGAGSLLEWRTQGQSTAAGNEGAGLIKNGTGTLDWGAGPGTGNTRFNGGFTINAGTVVVTGSGALGSGALNLNGGSLVSSGTLNFANSAVNLGSDIALEGTGASTFSGSVALGSSTRTITNTATGARTFSGNISASSASAGLTLAGTGTTTLGGANTYTGNTTVEGGQLNLADNAQLRFTIGGNGINNQLINSGGTVSLDGDFVFDLTGASTTLDDSWTLAIGAISYAGSLGTFSVLSTAGAFTETSLGSGLWTREQNGATYQFSEVNSVLSVVPEPSTYALLSLAAAGVGAHIIRRRRR
jgi:fibronectin-binding autotransporter adhesin